MGICRDDELKAWMRLRGGVVSLGSYDDAGLSRAMGGLGTLAALVHLHIKVMVVVLLSTNYYSTEHMLLSVLIE